MRGVRVLIAFVFWIEGLRVLELATSGGQQGSRERCVQLLAAKSRGGGPRMGSQSFKLGGGGE